MWRDWALSLLEMIGVNKFCKKILSTRPRILMFHKIYPQGRADNHLGFIDIEMFERLVEFLHANYNLYTLYQLSAHYQEHGEYPKDAVVLTFDDGYRSFKEYALPVLQNYRVPSTIFICPQLVDTGEVIWPDQLIDAFEAGRTSVKDRQELTDYLETLKKMDMENRSEALSGTISRHDSAGRECIDNDGSELMGWDEIREVLSTGLVEIGSHSMTHSILANESNERAEYEIKESKNVIEKRLGVNVHSFCYPNGQSGDYSEDNVRSVEESGYVCAVTSEFGFVDMSSSPFLLARFGGDFHSLHRARKYIDGVELVQRKIVDGI